jgi:hypothetical protein
MDAPENAGLTLWLDELTTRPHAAARVAARLRAGIAEPGGIPFALWAPQIGGGMNELLRITAWTRTPPAVPLTDLLVADPDIAQGRRRVLTPLARGTATPREGGICTVRRFLLPRDNVPELVRISQEAWASFEDDSPAEVLGQWLFQDTAADDTAEVLMATRYPSLAMWEATRFWKPEAAGAAAQQRRAEWGPMMRRRRTLLLDTSVIVLGPAPMEDS